MGELSRELRLAELRAADELSATILDVESVPGEHGDEIRVTYEFVDEASDVGIDTDDVYAVPTESDASYDFVRLCRSVHVPLESAHEDLVGMQVPITWTGDDWRIRLDDEDAGAGKRRGVPLGDDAKLSPSLALALAVTFPVVAPLVFVHLWPRWGAPRALFGTLLTLFGWVLVALTLLQSQSYGLLYVGSAVPAARVVGTPGHRSAIPYPSSFGSPTSVSPD
ncbi:hypothetical protein [Halopiger goleimassiliensis]|uniref:hypothetical protein n=1 Tax=Halopiger goleimassiliensis TaxID=1293048 RepID=UPI000677F4C4|nr:hypothetical protein [Halopiger goleimassiliensis]